MNLSHIYKTDIEHTENICVVCWDNQGESYCVCKGLLCKICRSNIEICPYCRRQLKILYANNRYDFLFYLLKLFKKYQQLEEKGESTYDIICICLDYILCKEHVHFWNSPTSKFHQLIILQLNKTKKEYTSFGETKYEYYYRLYKQLIL